MNVDYRPLSLSGVPLAGNRIVRTIYLDESGTSLTTPVAVVCGVIIDADRQWEPVEMYMRQLVAELVPSELRPTFVFHAKELFHGCFGKNKDHPKEARETLRRLLEIPLIFGLPISFGFHRKSPSEESPERSAKLKIAIHHTMAYILCALGCEMYMHDHARPGEIATMVAENNNDTKRLVKVLHSVLQGYNPDLRRTAAIFGEISIDRKYLPIRKIKDTIHFAQKNEAIFLQLADAFGFIFRGFLEGRTNADEFLKVLLTEPNNYASLRSLESGTKLFVPEPRAQNPSLIPPTIWTTIPGYGKIRPQE